LQQQTPAMYPEKPWGFRHPVQLGLRRERGRPVGQTDIWRAATLMLKRYGDKALEESRTCIDELAADGDHDGADTWRWITTAVEHLANTTPPGPPH
jgi:hypothetical protein